MDWTKEFIEAILIFAKRHPTASYSDIERHCNGGKLSEQIKGMIYDIRFKNMSIEEVYSQFLKPSSAIDFVSKMTIPKPLPGSTRGRSSNRGKFDLYPYQKTLLESFEKDVATIICKSRQLGISILSIGYVLYYLQNNPNKNALVYACNYSTCLYLWSEVQQMIKSTNMKIVPPFYKTGLTFDNGSTLSFCNNISSLDRKPFSLAIIDEPAFINNMEKQWLTIVGACEKNYQLIIQSTPLQSWGCWFYDMWQNWPYSRSTTYKLTWQDCSYLDQKWRDDQDIILGKQGASRECDANFI